MREHSGEREDGESAGHAEAAGKWAKAVFSLQ